MRHVGEADGFLAGAIGEPGERTFLLELRAGGDVSWFLLEKRQVAAMALESAQLLEETGFIGAGASSGGDGLESPDAVKFRVAQIDMVYTEVSGLIDIVLQPADPEQDEAVAFSLTPVQLDRMARAAAFAVEGGRPACPRCGLAMDAEGHHCPVDNGDLREHRP